MAEKSPGSFLTHPLYTMMEPIWRMALDVYEGLGGFIDPDRPYLVPHPREWLDHSVKTTASDGEVASVVPNPNPTKPSPKLRMRRRLARYENVAESILNQVSGALFLSTPSRTFGKDNARQNEQVLEWWQDVDGIGTDIDAFMEDSWTAAATFGHIFILADKPMAPADTAADVIAPVLRRYTPLDVIDWIVDEQGALVAVKLVESAPRQDFGERFNAETHRRVRVVTTESWDLYDSKGDIVSRGEHGFGRLPIVVLYGKRRPMTPVIGKAVMGDPFLYVDLYNLVSEVRELLRNQTFAILNVPIGTGDQASVEREQSILGSQVGTGGVMFSTQAIGYVSPPGTNAEVYHEHIDRLARMIYRLASAPWEGDSKDAESGESRKIKRAEQTHVLTKYAGELQRAELELLELCYRGLFGADGWEAAWDTEEPNVSYVTEFEPPDIEALAKATADAIALDMGETYTHEAKKRFAKASLREVGLEVIAKVDAEIDAQSVPTSEEKQAALLARAAESMREPVPEPEQA